MEAESKAAFYQAGFEGRSYRIKASTFACRFLFVDLHFAVILCFIWSSKFHWSSSFFLLKFFIGCFLFMLSMYFSY